MISCRTVPAILPASRCSSDHAIRCGNALLLTKAPQIGLPCWRSAEVPAIVACGAIRSPISCTASAIFCSAAVYLSVGLICASVLRPIDTAFSPGFGPRSRPSAMSQPWRANCALTSASCDSATSGCFGAFNDLVRSSSFAIASR